MKRKLGLVGLGLCALLSGCMTIKPTGHIALAYVPDYSDDKLMTDGYYYHMCSHPVSMLEYYDNGNYINHDSRTEVGIELKW